MNILSENILPFVFILLVLVIVHEAGHYFTAKAFGIKVLEFGFGYPPRIWGFKRGETEYTINALPLGGFVRLLGEEDPTDPRSLAAQAAWKRLIVMGAGSFMNFVLAIVLLSVAFMIPREVGAGRATISAVVPDSPAAQAGLKPGDVIYKIDGRDIPSTQEAIFNVRLHLGETVPIVVQRTDPATNQTSFHTVYVKPRWAPPPYTYTVQPGQTVDDVATATGFPRTAVRQAAEIDTRLPAGKELLIKTPTGETINFTPEEGDTVEAVAKFLRVSDDAVASAAGLPDQNTLPAGRELRFTQGPTGIALASQYGFTETRKEGPITAVRHGWRQTFDSLKLARNEIISWFKGASSPALSGPIGIAQTTGEAVKQAGWKSLVDLAALLSINLAILNILPLPMLDGGRMAFVLIEIARRGRRIAPDKEALVHFSGMVALLILVVVLSYFDVARIVKGETILR